MLRASEGVDLVERGAESVAFDFEVVSGLQVPARTARRCRSSGTGAAPCPPRYAGGHATISLIRRGAARRAARATGCRLPRGYRAGRAPRRRRGNAEFGEQHPAWRRAPLRFGVRRLKGGVCRGAGAGRTPATIKARWADKVVLVESAGHAVPKPTHWRTTDYMRPRGPLVRGRLRHLPRRQGCQVVSGLLTARQLGLAENPGEVCAFLGWFRLGRLLRFADLTSTLALTRHRELHDRRDGRRGAPNHGFGQGRMPRPYARLSRAHARTAKSIRLTALSGITLIASLVARNPR
jgi:hypothetical protein